jgi:hypothetical protein
MGAGEVLGVRQPQEMSYLIIEEQHSIFECFD